MASLGTFRVNSITHTECLFPGFFVYFDDLAVEASTDCDDDYVQFGRDILFITSYRSDKFCHRIQVSTVQYWSVQYM